MSRLEPGRTSYEIGKISQVVRNKRILVRGKKHHRVSRFDALIIVADGVQVAMETPGHDKCLAVKQAYRTVGEGLLNLQAFRM
jgi:hypothetical protein